MPTERIHYSRKPIDTLQPKEQRPGDFLYKPVGFWYSIDGDWERWCKGEMPDWIEGRMVYRVSLNGERIMRLNGAADILRFHHEYGRMERRDRVPDWIKVAQSFDGIEIAPYCWELRLDFDVGWYYPWDAASGCLWRPHGATVELLRDERSL